MKEVRPNKLENGEDYYIEMVGRYKNRYRESGKAIGKGFIRTITFGEILQEGHGSIDFGGISPDCFNDDDIFVKFQKVVPVNPDERECGICHYKFYPATTDNFNELTLDQSVWSCGGYKFFKMKTPELVKKVKMQAVDNMASKYFGPGIESQEDVKSVVASFIPPATRASAGGKKRRKKSCRKTRRKIRKTKRKSPKKKTKRRR